MVKFRRIYSLILLSVLVMGFNVFASTNTYVRTEDNYLVPSDIVVTESNKWNVMNTPAVDASEKVYDFAELFTDDEETKLYKEISKYIKDYSLDMAIVTIDSNPKSSATVYGDDFYDYNLFNSDGLLCLIDMDNREVSITTTGLAMNMYTDFRIDSILDSVYPKLSASNYYDAASLFVTIIGNFAKIGVSSDDGNIIIGEDGSIKKNLYLAEITLFSFIGTFIIILIMIFKNRMVKTATSSREYLNKETMKVVHISEMFLGSNVSKVRISDSSSGRSGSGSSSRSGSSGRSHGGGSRRF